MKTLFWILLFSMMSGGSEILTLAAGDLIKGKLGRSSRKTSESK